MPSSNDSNSGISSIEDNMSIDTTYNPDLDKMDKLQFDLLTEAEKIKLFKELIPECNPIIDPKTLKPVKDENNITMLDCFILEKNGKYLKDKETGEYIRNYYKKDPKTNNYLKDKKGKFIIDPAKFNTIRLNEIFKSYMNKSKKATKIYANEIDNNNNYTTPYIPFYQLNLLQIALELKNTLFSILDDILAGNMTLDIILKENRLFYVGLTILIIAIILYIYDYAINPNDPMTGGNGLVEVRHIYEKR